MRILVMACLFLAAVLAPAAEPAVTPAQARAISAECTDALVQLNQSLSDNYYHTGAFMQAVGVLERVTVLDPHLIDAYASAAWLAWSSKETARAQQIYDRMLAANPDSADAYFEVGVFNMRLKKDEEALRWFGEAIAHGLTGPRRHLYGHTLTRLGRTAEALAFWQKLAADDPADEVAKREAEKLRNPAP